MKLTDKEKWLMDHAYKVGESGSYKDLNQWLTYVIDDNGNTVDSHIAWDAARSNKEEWKNITSAPSGKDILISRDFNNPGIVVARFDGRQWSTGPSPIDYYQSPTHWMELPDKPKQKVIEKLA